MSVQMARQWYWSSILVSDRYDQPIINNYSVRMEFTTMTEDNHQHNIAYRRMKFWFNEVMESCVLIAPDDKRLSTWQQTGTKVLILPEDPVDQLVGIMLYSKISAIVQEKFIIDEISISSPIDDDVIYHHFSDENLGPFVESGWWNDSRPIWQNKPARSKGKVISLDRSPDWKDHDLDWPNDQESNILEMTTDHADH